MTKGPTKVIAVNGSLMAARPMRDLIGRCYADPQFQVEPEALCDFLAVRLDDESDWIKLFVATDVDGLCGMSIVTANTDALNPLPWVNYFVAEKREARDPLVEATIGYIRSLGFRKFFLFNLTGASDAAHLRIFKKYVTGTVGGSMICYEIGS